MHQPAVHRLRRIAAVAVLAAVAVAASACTSEGETGTAAGEVNRPTTPIRETPTRETTEPGPAGAANPDRTITLDGQSLTVDDVVTIANGAATVELSPGAEVQIDRARAVIDHYIDEQLPAYGITTMYGADFKTTLSPEDMARFGRTNIIQEATRVGDGTMPIVDTGTMRAAWALLANSYARGRSGASRDLAQTLLDRVNSGDVPDDVEYGNSMGDADLTANAQAALFLLDDGVELKAGEPTNLLTHNFIAVAYAAQIVQRAEGILQGEQAALALSMEGFRANPGPLTDVGSRQDPGGARTAVKDELRRLLDGSLLWNDDGPRQLQDYLSLRDGAENLAALRLELDQYTPVLEAFANSNHGSPVVDVDRQELISVPDFDTSQVTLGLDSLRQALGLVVIASNSRGLKLLSHPFTDLASGLTEGDPNEFNGIYTRNITYLMTSLERDALVATEPVMTLTESYMAEGDEDYSPAFPNSVLLGLDLVDRVEQVMTLEALIGAVAVDRRITGGELDADDVPVNLRELRAGIIERSPLAIDVDEQYDLAPLLEFYIGRFPSAPA